jgi:hypothetical protein
MLYAIIKVVSINKSIFNNTKFTIFRDYKVKELINSSKIPISINVCMFEIVLKE